MSERATFFPCIGGPLAGEYANRTDFFGESRFLGGGHENGRYEHLAEQYTIYECPGMRAQAMHAGDFPPYRVYLHQSLLKPLRGDRG